MIEAFPPGLLTGGGLAGLVTLSVLLVLFGRLIPRSWHAETIADKDKQIEYLKAALETEVERGRVRDGQVSELLEHARTTNAFIRALPRPAERPAGQGAA